MPFITIFEPSINISPVAVIIMPVDWYRASEGLIPVSTGAGLGN